MLKYNVEKLFINEESDDKESSNTTLEKLTPLSAIFGGSTRSLFNKKYIVEKLSDAVTSVEKTFEKNRTAQKQRRLKARINQRELGYKPITQKPEVEPLGAFSKNLSDRDVENYYNYGERGINYLQTQNLSGTQQYMEGLFAGSFLQEPLQPFSELDGWNKTLRGAGYVTGMLILGRGLSFAQRIGQIAVPPAVVTSNEKLKQAANLWKNGSKTEAIQMTGIGSKQGSLTLDLLDDSGRHLNRFFNNVDTLGPDAARLKEFGRGAFKEGVTWTGIDQVTVDNKDGMLSLQDRLLRIGPSMLAGGLFSRSQYKYAQILTPGHTFTNSAGKEVLGYSKTQYLEPVATSLLAGLTAPMLTEEGTDGMSRTVAGIATVAMSRISGGFPFNVAKQDIGRAFELSGVKDPVARNLLSEQVWAQSTKLIPELTKIYGGMDFYNKQGFRGVLRTFEPKEGETGGFGVIYDVYYPNGKLKQKGVKTSSLDKFLSSYKSSVLTEIIEPLEQGVIKTQVKKVVDGVEETVDEFVPIKHFQSEKDLKNFIEQKSWGILDATGGDKQMRIEPKPGFTYNQLLIEELLKRGYTANDIIPITRTINKQVTQSVMVKNLKQNDAFEITRLFGRDTYENNAGKVFIDQKGGKVNAVEVYKRLPGTTRTSTTKDATPAPPIKVVMVDDGSGGQKIKIVPSETRASDVLPMPQKPGFFNNNSLIKLNNGNTIAINMKYDLKNKTASNIPKALRADFGEQLGANFTLPKSPWSSMLSRTISLDEKYKITDEQGKRLRNILFGKSKRNQLTDEEHQQYQGLLEGLETNPNISDFNKRMLELRINTDKDRTWGFLGDLSDSITSVNEGIQNQFVAPYRFWSNIGEKYNSPTFAKLSKLLLTKAHLTMVKKSEGIEHMAAFDELARTIISDNNLNISMNQLNDMEMLALVMSDRFGKISNLNASQRKALKPLVDEHNKYMNLQYKFLEEAGVRETYFDKSGRKRFRKIQKVDQFMPLTISDDFSHLAQNNEHLLAAVLSDIKAGIFKKTGKVPSEKDVMDTFKKSIARSEKHGIYGTQFSRVFDLEPYYYLDSNGNVLLPTKKSHWKLKEGDKLNGRTIDRKLQTYDMDYENSMNRYISRAANIGVSNQLFHYEGLFPDGNQGGGGRYGQGVTPFFNAIKTEIPSRNQKAIKGYLEDDFKFLLGMNGTSPLSTQFSRLFNDFTGFTATSQLSGFFSPIKNLGLGSAQSWATFGESALAKGTANFSMDYIGYLAKNLEPEDLIALRKSGASLSGQKMVESYTFSRIFEQAKFTKIAQKGATLGMTAAEVVNRDIAAYTALYAAQTALDVLTGTATGLIFKGKSRAQQSVEAERMLRKTLMMTDEDFYRVLSKKMYFKQKVDKKGKIIKDEYEPITLSADDVDLKTGRMKEFKVGDEMTNGKVVKVEDSPQKFDLMDKALIMARGHSTTQGLTDDVYLPKILNNPYMKPLTLFTRIATTVTDNAYFNVLKPAVEDGNVLPMLRFVGGSYGNGYASEYFYSEVMGTPAEQFRAPSQKFFDRLIQGEIFGIFSIMAEIGQNGAQNIANISQLNTVLDVLNDGTKLAKPIGTKALLKDKDQELNPMAYALANMEVSQKQKIAYDSFASLFALSSQARKIYKNNKYPEYLMYKKYRSYQKDWFKNVLGKPDEFNKYDGAPTTLQRREFLYQALESDFYSDSPISISDKSDKSSYEALFYASVFYRADTKLKQNQERMDKGVVQRAFNEAFDETLNYVKDLKPRKIAAQKKNYEKSSKFSDFQKRITPEEATEFNNLESFYKNRYTRISSVIGNNKEAWFNKWNVGAGEMPWKVDAN